MKRIFRAAVMPYRAGRESPGSRPGSAAIAVRIGGASPGATGYSSPVRLALRTRSPGLRLHVLMADLPAKIRTGMDFPVEDSIAGWVWQHQQPLTINTDAETRFPEFARALLETGIKSFAVSL